MQLIQSSQVQRFPVDVSINKFIECQYVTHIYFDSPAFTAITKSAIDDLPRKPRQVSREQYMWGYYIGLAA